MKNLTGKDYCKAASKDEWIEIMDNTPEASIEVIIMFLVPDIVLIILVSLAMGKGLEVGIQYALPAVVPLTASIIVISILLVKSLCATYHALNNGVYTCQVTVDRIEVQNMGTSFIAHIKVPGRRDIVALKVDASTGSYMLMHPYMEYTVGWVYKCEPHILMAWLSNETSVR